MTGPSSAPVESPKRYCTRSEGEPLQGFLGSDSFRSKENSHAAALFSLFLLCLLRLMLTDDLLHLSIKIRLDLLMFVELCVFCNRLCVSIHF